MSSKLPKYVRAQGKFLFYQRDYPAKLRHLAPTKTFTYALKVTADNSVSAELNRKIAQAADSYALACKRIGNTDPNAYSVSELDTAAADYLRKRNLQPGQFTSVMLDLELSRQEAKYQVQLQAHKEDYALAALPEMENVIAKEQEGEALTFNDQVVVHALKKLIDKSKQRPQTLSQLWKEYAAGKGIDINTREGKRQQIWWDKFIAIVGDALVAPETLSHIHDGIDRYIAERQQAGIKGQSIKRELSQPLAAIRKASKKYRLGWVLEITDIERSRKKVRNVLSHEEQRRLVNFCLSTTTKRDRDVAAAVLLMLQCGGMPSEVNRLVTERIALDAGIPHIIISGKVKTTSRPRVVPVVIGVNFIMQHIGSAINWLQSCSDSTHSLSIKKFMARATGNNAITGHSLRHTFRTNCIANGADPTVGAAIGGWSGKQIGMSDVMLGYGAEGLSQSEGLKGFQRESLKIHRHLLHEHSHKVVQFPIRI